MACRVCGSADLSVVLDLGEQPYCNGFSERGPDERFPLRLCLCRACTTVQIDHTIPKEVMFGGEYLYVSGTTETLRRHFGDSSARLVAKLHLAQGDLVVDIGSNDGTWLSCYPSGIRTLGVEPSELAVTASVETKRRFFDLASAREIVAERGRAKLVTAAGVFFHLEDLHGVVDGVEALLDRGGTFCVQAIYLKSMLDACSYDNVYFEHLLYWSVTSLSALFAMHGMEVYSVDLLPIHGGSLEVLVGRRGEHGVDGSVRWFLDGERDLANEGTYRTFAERVRRNCGSLMEILGRYRAEGRVVHAFGAPAKGSTLINTCGITADLVPLAVERNPMKFGKVIPGTAIPIVDEASAPRPDAYLILPWNFLPEFLRKKRGFLLDGGAFIVPIPEPRVLDLTSIPWDDDVHPFCPLAA